MAEVDWNPVFRTDNVNEIDHFITSALTSVLDIVCPLTSIRVRRGDNLYLSTKTRSLMAARVTAKAKYDKKKTKKNLAILKDLRNKVTSSVKRDRIQTSLKMIKENPEDQRLIWTLANKSLGKSKGSLPSSITTSEGRQTVGDLDAASTIASYYVNKVARLRESIPQTVPAAAHKAQIHCQNSASGTPSASNTNFKISFVNEERVTKMIKKISNSKSAGLDGIPIGVYKMGVRYLASPLARLINVSLATCKYPTSYKRALVLPIHKGKHKPHTDPASYRPIALLPAASKIMEAHVRDDLQAFLDSSNGLPDSQFGFRPDRSPIMAVEVAHASWVEAKRTGKTLGVLAFDLTAAFDTVNKDQLLPKLKKLGVCDASLQWFEDYMSGSEQAVIWNGVTSNFVKMVHGIRQGAVLSPTLFLALISDMPDFVGFEGLSGYADDTCIWASGSDLEDVKRTLETRAAQFTKYVASCGLVLNASKTQLLISGKRPPSDFTVTVNGANVSPTTELELLGVKIDQSLSFRPQQERLAVSMRQRASTIARLAHHLPRGPYLEQLAHGLVLGKAQYAASLVVQPRLNHDAPSHPPPIIAAQVAINDVARTLTGHGRTDHVRVGTLLNEAGLPSLNTIAAKAMAGETWKAFHSSDGPNGDRNLLGASMFGSRKPSNNLNPSSRQTRFTADGKVIVPLRGENTFTTHAVSLWNMSAELRDATSKTMATGVIHKLARNFESRAANLKLEA